MEKTKTKAKKTEKLIRKIIKSTSHVNTEGSEVLFILTVMLRDTKDDGVSSVLISNLNDHKDVVNILRNVINSQEEEDLASQPPAGTC